MVAEINGPVRGRRCPGCGDWLSPDAGLRAVFCSGVCRSRQWRRLRRVKLRAAALERDEGRRVCPVCGAVWVAGVDHRRNAVYCSPRCRRRAWAARKEPFAQASG